MTRHQATTRLVAALGLALAGLAAPGVALAAGPTLAGWLTCARCQEKSEFAMDASELAGSGMDGDPAEPTTVRVKDL